MHIPKQLRKQEAEKRYEKKKEKTIVPGNSKKPDVILKIQDKVRRKNVNLIKSLRLRKTCLATSRSSTETKEHTASPAAATQGHQEEA